MILYHGSAREILKPDLSFSRNNVDFGRGFYTTPLRQQAEKWASRFKRKSGFGILNIYDFDERLLKSGLRVLEFDGYNEEWLDYIIMSRSGRNRDSYDIVIGGVANDKVFDTLELFFDGLIEKKTALGRLRYEKPNQQLVFRSQDVIDRHLKFIKSEVLS